MTRDDFLAMPQGITFKPVGVVRTDATQSDVRERGDELAYDIEVFPEYQEALEGMDGFTHLIVLFHFNQLRPEQQGVLRVQPRRMLKFGFTLDQIPLVGVFCLDSPSRPNPIGVSMVKVLQRSGNRIRVQGLEAFDGSPVLDIKPYTPDRAISDVGVPQWFRRLAEASGGKV
jgi:tRNA-Thr(GGU) m(6)t(6)A37 methyltransferase TsaA